MLSYRDRLLELLEKLLNDNPYQSTLNEVDEPIVENRPVSIDLQTAATFFAVAVPLSAISYFVIRWFAHMLPSPRSAITIACGSATMLGGVAAWRTWYRLSQVHIKRTQLRKNHERLLAEYSQHTSAKADENPELER